MKRYELFSAISAVLLGTGDFNIKITSALSLVGKYARVSRVQVFIDGAGNDTTSSGYEWCARGTASRLPALPNPRYAMIPSWKRILREGIVYPGNAGDLPEDVRIVLESREILSMIVYPIVIGGETRGFMRLDECRKNRTWGKPELNFLRSIAGLISDWYAQEVQKNRLQNTLDAAHLGTWEWNIRTGMMVINETWAEMLGYSLSELVPASIGTWERMMDPDAIQDYRTAVERHFKGESAFFEFESRFRHRDGHWVWILDRGKVVEWSGDGEPVLMFGTHEDITVRKKAEENLLESEKRFNLALEGTGAGLWDWDMANGTVFFSSRWKRMLGYEDNEVENSLDGWKKLWHPDDVEEIEKAMHDHLDGKSAEYEIVHRLRHKNGEWRWILTRGRLLKDQHGKPCRWIGTNLDITESKEQSEEMERFFSVNLDLLCIADTDGNFLKVNKAWEDILGYDADTLEGRKFLDFVHPEDLPGTLEAIAGLSRQEKVLNFVNRYHHRDGTWRYIEWRSHPYGKYIYAAARDITEHIEWERKLQDISIRDPLTNIYNRRHVFERLEGILAEYRRHGKPFSVSLLDIDHFKNINDRYGHQAGDFILTAFAKKIGGNLRSYDLFGRYGGEEFIIVSPNTGRNYTAVLVQRILDKVRESEFVFNEEVIRFTFSCGISDSTEFDNSSITSTRMIELSDERLYLAKKTGRNRIESGNVSSGCEVN